MDFYNEIIGYKKLLDDEIIDSNEFGKLKESAFARLTEENNDLAVLRELKKLLDEEAITEKEFDSLRNRIINNGYKAEEKPAVIPEPVEQPDQKEKFKNMLADKRIVMALAAAVLLVLIVGTMVIINGRKALPGGVHFGDSYDKVMKAALKLDSNAKESEYGSIDLKTSLYGYDCYVSYDVTDDEPLESVFVMTEDGYDKQIYDNVVKELTKIYGRPESNQQNEDGEDEAIWKFKNMEIYATYYDEIMISFRRPS